MFLINHCHFAICSLLLYISESKVHYMFQKLPSKQLKMVHLGSMNHSSFVFFMNRGNYFAKLLKEGIIWRRKSLHTCILCFACSQWKDLWKKHFNRLYRMYIHFYSSTTFWDEKHSHLNKWVGRPVKLWPTVNLCFAHDTTWSFNVWIFFVKQISG